MNGQRPQSISKVLIHQSALARLYFVKDFEAGHSVELKPISHFCHLFRFAKWSEKRLKCQQKRLGRRTPRLVLSSPTDVLDATEGKMQHIMWPEPHIKPMPLFCCFGWELKQYMTWDLCCPIRRWNVTQVHTQMMLALLEISVKFPAKVTTTC